MPDKNILMAFVTVIMPVRNEEDFIERSLGSILAQAYPHDRLEVLVADGMSTDRTRALVTTLSAQTDILVTLLDNPGRIVPTGFNRALRIARGDVIIRIDGHCEVPPDYVRRCVESLAQTQADCVGGPLITVGVGLQARAIALAQSSHFGVGGASFRLRDVKPGFVDTVAFGAYHRDVFERIGKLDEELVRNQDDEFNFRLTQAGGKIWLDPKIQSIYYSRANLRRLWQQYFQYGLYKVRVIQKRGAVPALRHLAPAIFVLGIIGSGIVAFLTSKPRWLLLVAGPYALANGLATFWTARAQWQVLPLLPLAFAVLHFAYGLGFLAGLWRWRRHGIPYLSLAVDDS